MPNKRLYKNSPLNKHRRAYRDLDKTTFLDNSDVLAQRVLQDSIYRTTKRLDHLNILIENINNKVTRVQNKEFNERFAQLIDEQDSINAEIQAHKTKIEHLRSQIERVNVELEKYSTIDDRFSAEKTINILESRLLISNQKVNGLRLAGIRQKDVVDDLLLMRRRFQATRNNVIAKLMTKKREIKELNDHYTIAFSNGMKICQDVEVCRIKAAKQLKDHLQEMRQLIRAAESNDILQQFMINKATAIELDSGAVPKREILENGYREMTNICENQLTQIKEFAPKTSADDLQQKRRLIFSQYLYENEITENIEDTEKEMMKLQLGISMAKTKIDERKEMKSQITTLNVTLQDGQAVVNEENERAVKVESMLRKYLTEIHEIYKMLRCKEEFSFENSRDVDEFNVDLVLQFIEMQLRQVIFSVYCQQEQEGADIDSSLVHGIPIVKPRMIPPIELVAPCPECSQIEARASPDVENIRDFEAKLAKVKQDILNRNLMSKMHNIEDCPKPGSKAVLSKSI